jgi:hypothetical protein
VRVGPDFTGVCGHDLPIGFFDSFADLVVSQVTVFFRELSFFSGSVCWTSDRVSIRINLNSIDLIAYKINKNMAYSWHVKNGNFPFRFNLHLLLNAGEFNTFLFSCSSQ